MAGYGTDEGYAAYHQARGVALVDLTGVAAARLRASEWIDDRWRAAFPGWKVGRRAQIREWPRYDAFDVNADYVPSDTVPVEIENATYEAAMLLQRGVTLRADYTPAKYKRASVDGAVSVEYATFGGASDIQTSFALVEQWLSPLVTGGVRGGSDLSAPISRVG